MKKDNSVLKAAALVTGLGLNVIVTLLLCIWIGSFLDKKFGTGFWFYIFLLLGFASAFRNVYYMTKRFYEKQKRKEEEELKYWEELRGGKQDGKRR